MMYKECVNGATDTLTPENRASILKNLQSLREQVYNEGNADCAGRHVFTGYKTNKQLTFGKDEAETAYEITEKISFEDIEEKRYYSNNVVVPNNPAEVQVGVAIDDDPDNLKYYDEDSGRWENLGDMQIGAAFVNVITDLSYDDWEADNFEVRPNQAIYFKETGELILGTNVANELSSKKAELSITYEKKGFSEGELRPEHYFDCKDITDPDNEIEYTKENQEIKFTVSFNQSLTVNTQASDVMDASIGRDIDELTTAVQAAIAAHDKVTKLEEMKKEAQYSDPASQEALDQWLEAAQKEAVYADDNMQKIYSRGVGKFQKYKDTVTLARTDLGSRESRLLLTEDRMANQQSNFEQLKSRNEDMELSDIIIQYTAAYNAYQASLQASAKANGQTLLNYL